MIATFKNPKAAQAAATSYEMEENKKWIVMQKRVSFLGIIYFCPFRECDCEDARADGWDYIPE